MVAAAIGQTAPTAYRVRTIAGGVQNGFDGDNGPALLAKFRVPLGIAVDGAGNIYIADQDNNRIRRIDRSGIITTIVGNNNLFPYTNTAGSGTATILKGPRDVAVASNGDVYFTDAYTIRRYQSGTVFPVAGSTGCDGRLHSNDGVAALKACLDPRYLTMDANTLPYFTEGSYVYSQYPTYLTWQNTVRRLDTFQALQTVAGVYTSIGYNGDNRTATTAYLDRPTGIAIHDGAVYICDHANDRVRRVKDGVITTHLVVDNPLDIAVGPDGTMYLLHQIVSQATETPSMQISRINADLTLTRLVGGGTNYTGNNIEGSQVLILNAQNMTVDAAGLLYYVETYGPTTTVPASRVRLAEPEQTCEFTTTSPLPSGQVSVAYLADIAYTSASSQEVSYFGSLPPGLRLTIPGSRTVRLQGIPTAAGKFTFDLLLSPCNARKTYEVTILPAAQLTVQPESIPLATQGCPYSAQFQGAGGTAPYSFQVLPGALPLGLTLSQAGLLSGTPSQTVERTLRVSVTDAVIPPRSGFRDYPFTVAPPLTFITPAPAQGNVGVDYYAVVDVQGGATPASYSAQGLPPGLVIETHPIVGAPKPATSGLIRGTPTAVFDGSVTIRATIAGGCFIEQSIPLRILSQPPDHVNLTISAESVALRNTYQAAISLDRPAPQAMNGTLSIAFQPASGINTDSQDEVVFATNPATRSISFAVEAGQTTARFNGAENIQFNTGTVAGTIRLKADLPMSTTMLQTERELAMAVTPPQLLRMEALARQGNSITVTVVGYAPRRLVGSGTVEVVPRSGVNLSGSGSVSLPDSFLQEFVRYFGTAESKRAGSQFQFSFPIAITGGNASDVQTVRVRLNGASGEQGNQVEGQ
jgi:hypothetical protein